MRATKQITYLKHLTYAERLSYLNLPTLLYRFRRIRGDMIMVFKIVTGFIESTVSCNFNSSHSVSRGIDIKLHKSMCIITLLSFLLLIELFFIWNGLPDHVVSACSVRIFEKRLDFSGETKIACTIGKHYNWNHKPG